VRAIRDAAVVVPFVGVEVFDGHPESRPWHPAGVPVKERPEAADIALAGLSTQPPTAVCTKCSGSSIRSSAMPNVSSS
jgi:hypothetical protein